MERAKVAHGGPERLERVLISVASYRRPAQLGELLASIAIAAKSSAIVDVLVVDNDPAGSAMKTVRNSPVTADYVLEKRPGIAAARNRGLERAHSYDAIVFVDDDERVANAWLRELIACADAIDADVVTGPVISVLPDDAPAWVRRGGFYQRPVPRDGAEVTAAATNNTLLRVASWQRAGAPRFDESFSATGGSDSRFFYTLRGAGLRIRFCAAAVVTEDIPPGRMSLGWLTRRALRSGMVAQRVWSSDRATVVVVGRAVLIALQGAVLMAAGVVFRGGRNIAPGFHRLFLGVGVLASLRGRRIEEYAR